LYTITLLKKTFYITYILYFLFLKAKQYFIKMIRITMRNENVWFTNQSNSTYNHSRYLTFFI